MGILCLFANAHTLRSLNGTPAESDTNSMLFGSLRIALRIAAESTSQTEYKNPSIEAAGPPLLAILNHSKD